MPGIYENGPQLWNKDGLPIRQEAIRPQNWGQMAPTSGRLDVGAFATFSTGHLSIGFDRGAEDLTKPAWASQESIQGNAANRLVGRFGGGL